MFALCWAFWQCCSLKSSAISDAELGEKVLLNFSGTFTSESLEPPLQMGSRVAFARHLPASLESCSTLPSDQLFKLTSLDLHGAGKVPSMPGLGGFSLPGKCLVCSMVAAGRGGQTPSLSSLLRQPGGPDAGWQKGLLKRETWRLGKCRMISTLQTEWLHIESFLGTCHW